MKQDIFGGWFGVDIRCHRCGLWNRPADGMMYARPSEYCKCSDKQKSEFKAEEHSRAYSADTVM